MEGVSFTYLGTGRPALSGVTLAVRPGETLALVGPSGAGKTTLAHLFMRFWDPDEGSVRLEGADLRDWTLDALRARIALVAQDTYLFNDTLRANILIARPDASEEALAEAVRRAALEDFVAALPEGLETRVGERGTQLSGGQRQRVAVARAVLKNAPILILDEATSHLDAVNEALLRRALGELMAERTTVVIAHQPVDRARRRYHRRARRRPHRRGRQPRRPARPPRPLRPARHPPTRGGRWGSGG